MIIYSKLKKKTFFQFSFEVFDVRMTENSRGPVIQIYDILTSSFTLTAWLYDITVQTITLLKDSNETSAKFILDQASMILAPTAADSKGNLRLVRFIVWVKNRDIYCTWSNDKVVFKTIMSVVKIKQSSFASVYEGNLLWAVRWANIFS